MPSKDQIIATNKRQYGLGHADAIKFVLAGWKLEKPCGFYVSGLCEKHEYYQVGWENGFQAGKLQVLDRDYPGWGHLEMSECGNSWVVTFKDGHQEIVTIKTT